MFGNKKKFKIQSPFSGWPKTRVKNNAAGQVTSYRVIASYLTPWGAKASFNIFGILLLLIFIDMAFVKGQEKHSDLSFMIVLIVMAIFGPLLWVFLRFFFRTVTMVEFRDDVIRIAHRWRWKNFDRKLPHQFEMVQHELTEDEAEKLNLDRQKELYTAQMKGKVPKFQKQKKYYQKSFHIVMWYLGQRVDIASVYGKRKAEALLTRLNAIEAMAEITGEVMAQESAPSPLGGRRPDPA